MILIYKFICFHNYLIMLNNVIQWLRKRCMFFYWYILIFFLSLELHLVKVST